MTDIREAMARGMLTPQMAKIIRAGGLDMDDDFLREWLADCVVPSALSAIREAGCVMLSRQSLQQMHDALMAADEDGMTAHAECMTEAARALNWSTP